MRQDERTVGAGQAPSACQLESGRDGTLACDTSPGNTHFHSSRRVTVPGIRICITAALLITLCGTHLDAQQRHASPVVPTRELVNGIVVLTHRADAFTRAPQWSIAAEPIATAGGVDAPDFDLTNVAVV